MKDKEVLVLVPNSHRMGGVANYFRVLKKFLGGSLTYIRRGEYSESEPVSSIPLRMVKDYYKFYRKARSGSPRIFINTSLGYGAFLRDSLYFLLAPSKRRKILFVHGWDKKFEERINNSAFLKFWLNNTMLRANHIIVLSQEFKEQLLEWGFNNAISTETTIVDDHLLQEKSCSQIMNHRKALDKTNLLYLGTINKAKGVWKVAKAVNLLAEDDVLADIHITIAGEGEERSALQEYVSQKKLPISFPGYMVGQAKTKTFYDASLYIFPSNHGEGMPTTILEAMAFGLPILTTRVGGIPDFFEEGKMGFYLENRDPKHVKEKIEYLIARPVLMKEISEYNFKYASRNFYASKVAERITRIIEDGKNKSKK